MIACLMLDVDGVLVAGRPADGLAWHHGLERDLGVPFDRFADAFFSTQWAEIVTGQKDIMPVLAMVLSEIAPHVSADAFVAYWFAMDARILEPVLSDLRVARETGLRVYLTTNQEHMRADFLMNNLGLGKEVDGIIYSAQAGCKKPERAFFGHAAGVTGQTADALLLVDDTLANVEAAQAAGWHAAHWDGSSSLGWILHDRLETYGPERGPKAGG